MKYQRTGQMLIRPLLMNTGTSAFDCARAFYAQYSDMNFEQDLAEYMRNGYVVTRPKLFAMARPIEHEGERIWFIQIAIGNLLELISVLPCRLNRIAFCRNNKADKMVVVELDKFIGKAMALYGIHKPETST